MLKKIKMKAISKGVLMKEVAKNMNISRSYMYRSIKNNKEDVVKRINIFLDSLDTIVNDTKK